MNRWTVEYTSPAQEWVLRNDNGFCHNYLKMNGSAQSSYKQCERELAQQLINERYRECPENGYWFARRIMELAKDMAGVPISIG